MFPISVSWLWYTNNNNNNNSKKVYVGSTQGAFKKDIITIEVVLHMKYTDIGLVYLIKKKQRIDPI